MLPLNVLKAAGQHGILVELKNGEAYNGRMEACDTWMNIHLKEVICTSKDGEKFWRMKEVYIRGNTIKYIRVPEDALDKVVEEKPRSRDARPNHRPGRGPGRGRGHRGEGGRGGGRGSHHSHHSHHH